MLTPYRPQFIEKIIYDDFGHQFRVIFAVSYINGEVKGRIVSAEPIALIRGSVSARESFTCLQCATLAGRAPIESHLINRKSFVSPYFSMEFLINSQPTRAPAFR